MTYTAHPLGKQDNLPLIAIFDKDGECVATLTMDDIAELFAYFMEEEVQHYHPRYTGLHDKLIKKLIKQKEKEDEEKPKGTTD